MVQAMIDFRKELDSRCIEWVDKSDSAILGKLYDGTSPFNIDRTHFDYNGNNVSVINGYGTYGGKPIDSKMNFGLLEVMVGSNEPVGWLTCEEAITLIFGKGEK